MHDARAVAGCLRGNGVKSWREYGELEHRDVLEALRLVWPVNAPAAPKAEPVAWPAEADNGMLRAMLGWRCSDPRDGFVGEAAMMDRVYHALYSHMRDRGYTAPPAPDREAKLPITDEMIEAACRVRHGVRKWNACIKQDHMAAWVRSHRVVMRDILTAALIGGRR
jgi:hypothetical protein